MIRGLLIGLFCTLHLASALQVPYSTSQPQYERSYLGQEVDLSSPDRGIFSLASGHSHQHHLPLDWSNASQEGSHQSQTDQQHDRLQWWLTNSNGSISIPATLPSQADLDLLRSGIITEPSIGLNEGALRWIIDETWTYTASLSPLLPEVSGYDSFLLLFQGLDTICSVSLGGRTLLNTDNQFREWTVEGKDLDRIIKSGIRDGQCDLNLTLVFTSAASWAAEESKREPHYPSQLELPDGPATTIYEFPHRQFIRKAQSDFGWDWGPALVPVGPQQPAYIIGFKKGASKSESTRSFGATGKTDYFFVKDTSSDIYKEGQQNGLPPDQTADWIVNVTLLVYSVVDQDELVLETDLSELSLRTRARRTSLKKGWNTLQTSFRVPSQGRKAPRLWWPSSHGSPILYALKLTLTASHQTTSWTRKVGFRTIVVNQELVSTEDIDQGWSQGSYFHIEVNDKRIYIQGTNLIPFDTLYPRISLDTIRWHLQSAARANQNLIRVWGGGLYQSDAFYDLCDEMGLLVWSETIFAVSMYPTYDTFLANVREEVSHQVRRLNHHPSHALWAGNNENEDNMLRLRKSLSNSSVHEAQYELLYDQVIREEVLANTKSRTYVPSSTTHGYLQRDPYIPRYLNRSSPDDVYGDGEYYGYQADQIFNLSKYSYETSYRLINEYGFHAMSSLYGLDRVLEKDKDYNFNSTVMRAHNKHMPAGSLEYPSPADSGQAEMTSAIQLYLPVPGQIEDAPITGDRTLLGHWSYATQILQAWYISIQTLEYRFRSSLPQRNSGGIVWQLNDIWPGSTSWASMEWGGRWKVLHYLLTRSQARISIYPRWHVDGEVLDLTVVSDLSDEEVEGTLRATWYDFDGVKLSDKEYPWTIREINATTVEPLLLAEYLPTNIDLDNVWLHLQVSARHRGKRYVNEEFFSRPGSLANNQRLFSNTSVLSLISLGHDRYQVTASQEGTVVPWVFLEHPEGVLGYFALDNDEQQPSNAFWLRPGESRVLKFVHFQGAKHRERERQKDGFTVRTLVRG